MMMVLGILFGLGIIVAPIIVWLKTKGQKRRLLKAIGSSLACFILMGVFAVNDHADYSAQAQTKATVQVQQQVRKSLEDVIKGDGFTIVSADGTGLLEVKELISVTVNSWAVATMKGDTKTLLGDIIKNGYSDLGNYAEISITYESNDYVDKYGASTTATTGFYTFSQETLQKIKDVDMADIDQLADTHIIAPALQ